MTSTPLGPQTGGSSPDDAVQAVLPQFLALTGLRKLIAIAGSPGSGKSTVAAALCSALTAQERKAAVVPMDGFHLDNTLLRQRGLLDRKGCPASFDATGFVHLVRRIATGEGVAYPLFDRDRDLSIAGAGMLPPETEFVIFEGNYLLLSHAPWRDLLALWTVSLFIDTPRAELECRLLQRWLDAGMSRAQALARRDANDLPNADLVLADSLPADLTLSN